MPPTLHRAFAIGLILLAGLAAGFASYRLAHRPSLTAVAAAAPGATATSEQETPQTPAHRPVPEQLPVLQLPDLAGKVHALSDYQGHPLILNFWATWCAPCRREMPLLGQLRRDYHRDGVEVVGLAVDFASAVREYVRTSPPGYPLLIGDDAGLAAIDQFGMEPVLPFSVFADARGRIIAVKVGELHREEAQVILDTMRSLAAGTTALPEARSQIAARLRELAAERAKAEVKTS